MPIKKSLIRLKRHVESISDGKQKVKILDVQKKLNQIYSSYAGIDFSINKGDLLFIPGGIRHRSFSNTPRAVISIGFFT